MAPHSHKTRFIVYLQTYLETRFELSPIHCIGISHPKRLFQAGFVANGLVCKQHLLYILRLCLMFQIPNSWLLSSVRFETAFIE